MIVFNYGGGRQTAAMCVMIAKEVLPRPDIAVMADTGRENQSTWDYLKKYTGPLMESLGCPIEIAPHELSKVDLYGHNGNLLLPAYTADGGKLRGFCSNEWKQRVVSRHLRGRLKPGKKWLGLALEEKARWRRLIGTKDGLLITECPLVDKMIDTGTCYEICRSFGWPDPPHSSCFMCPHKRNREWRDLRDSHPQQWQQAIELERQISEDDDQGGVFLHRSMLPIDQADIDHDESAETVRQCSLGMCFV